jgi:hypothetical protein
MTDTFVTATTPRPAPPAPNGATNGHLHEAAINQPLVRFYMTSDLRAATGLPRTHLDFYLREGLILPTARTESGYLLFDDAELATLRAIIAWRRDGLAIREIRTRLGR